MKQTILKELIQSDPLLAQYFQENNQNREGYWALAQQLMIDGIRYRVAFLNNSGQGKVRSGKKIKNEERICQNLQEKKQHEQPNNAAIEKPKKHYNVAYIKHNRFLSPKQRKDYVSPKVTQVIPKSPPHVIYGKPRVNLDSYFGCPYHDYEEQCQQNIPYAEPCSPKQYLAPPQRPVHQVHVRNPDLDIAASKSPPTNPGGHKPFKQVNSPPKQVNKNYGSDQNEGTIVVDNIVQVKARSPGTFKIVKGAYHQPKINSQESPPKKTRKQVENNLNLTVKNQPSKRSNKQRNVKNIDIRRENKVFASNCCDDEQSESCLSSKYHNETRKNKHVVESKIKDLIDRDKKNKIMEKDLKRQAERIRILEETVREGKQKRTREISNHDIISLSPDTSMSIDHNRLIEKYRQNWEKSKKMYQEIVSSNNARCIDCSCSESISVDSEDSSFAPIHIIQ